VRYPDFLSGLGGVGELHAAFLRGQSDKTRTGAPGSPQRTGFPASRRYPTAGCAAFIKESRMKFVDETNLDRKSGVPGQKMNCFEWRREKKLNLIRTINPEFKDLAQTWGWKMITVHEKMYP
jgi:hypothetical protein